uniref:Uncharacterized protein n=1 Tax=Oryza brachyantha TaxID=4533 RepID=J3M688_ORYBR
MEENFLKYFAAIPHLYCFALILDPHKKLKIMKIAFESIGDVAGLDYSEAFHLYRTKLGVTPQVPKQTTQKKASKSSALNLWKKFKVNDQTFPSSENRSKWNSDSELNHYLNTTHTDHDLMLDGDDVNFLA